MVPCYAILSENHNCYSAHISNNNNNDNALVRQWQLLKNQKDPPIKKQKKTNTHTQKKNSISQMVKIHTSILTAELFIPNIFAKSTHDGL